MAATQQTTYVDTDHFVVPGRGTVLIAPVDTDPFKLDEWDPAKKETFTGWDLLGGTSSENPPSFDKDGGDTTQQNVWEEAAVYTTQEPTSLSLSVNVVRVAKESLELVFPGGKWDDETKSYEVGNIGAVEKALFVVMIDGDKRAGFYLPKVSLSVGDMPEIDTENFFEAQMSAQILTSTKKGYRFKLYQPRKHTAAAPGVGG